MDEKIFEKFSESARFILISSQQLAETTQSTIGSEHVLMALVLNKGTFANEILTQYDINLDQIKLILSLHGIASAIEKARLNNDMQELLIQSVKIAANYSHVTVDAEHLLLAIVNNPQHVAHDIIERIGVNPQHIRKEIESLFDEIAEVDKLMKKEDKQAEKKQSKQQAKKTKTPALDYFTTDLTLKALKNELDPVIGRDQEIQRTLQILSRRTKNNPILVGEPGVGKTAIAEGLAQRIASGNVPTSLLGKRLISLDLTLLVAGTMYRGQFEERVKKIMEEIKAATDIILFIDEIHTMIGAGSAEGSLDAANILKPALAKGWIRLIGATTHEEYRKHIKKDSAFERRLQTVVVEEPTQEQSLAILEGLRPHYEQHHNVKITDEALKTAVKLSARYINDRFLPDKAIDLIDEAAAATQLTNDNTVAYAGQAKKLARLTREKDAAVAEENYQLASQLKAQIETLQQTIDQIKLSTPPATKPVIDAIAIAQLITQSTSIPASNLIETERIRFANLEQTLQQHIIGQNEAVMKVAQAIKRSRTGVADPNRPIGTFMFLGPTGVGKTELARVIAREIFGTDKALIKIDMTDFMERHNTSRLVGAPAGYVGYEDGGKLTEAVRRRPYAVVLFDEIEKAHPEVFNMLLQIMEEGQLADAKGQIVNFRNTIIILTSNLGMAELTRQAAIGFQSKGLTAVEESQRRYEEIKNNVTRTLKDNFRPEFLNRLDHTVVFQPLGKEQISEIIHQQIKAIADRLATQGYELEVTDNAIEQLIEVGFDPAYGARSLRRAIAEHIEGPVAEHILTANPKPGSLISIDFSKQNLALKTKRRQKITA